MSINSIADPLCLNFLVWFAEMLSYFSIKANKRKVRKYLKYVKEFLLRFGLANGKYLSIFVVVFARNVKVSHFLHVINFRERAHGKIHQCKVVRNKGESTRGFFHHNSKTKFIVPSSAQQQKQKDYCPFFSVAFVFGMGSYTLVKGADDNNRCY